MLFLRDFARSCLNTNFVAINEKRSYFYLASPIPRNTRLRLLTLNRGPIVRIIVAIKCPFKGYLFFVETVQDKGPIWDVTTAGWSDKTEQQCELSSLYQEFLTAGQQLQEMQNATKGNLYAWNYRNPI